jgi:transposase
VYVTCGDFHDGSEKGTKQFLAKHKMAVIPHPPYSPDLAPRDFFLFPKMKLKLKGRRFDTIEEIRESA